MSHLIEKLPGSVGEKSPPADVLINIIAVLNNLVVASPVAARDLLYFDGLRKLVFIKKKRDRSGPKPRTHPAPRLALPVTLLTPVPHPPALTVRSPPGRPPASWPTCGSTTSSTETSERYVPVAQGRQGCKCGAWRRDGRDREAMWHRRPG